MGLFNELFGTKKTTGKKRIETRVCRFEQIEARELLSVNPFTPPADIDVGVVYVENHSTDILHTGGDTFHVTWNGGADGTTLDTLVIDTRTANALGVYFNPYGLRDGGFTAFCPFKLLNGEENGVTATVEYTGDTILTINFTGFTAGKLLKFEIDLNEDLGNSIDAVVTGVDFEGSTFMASFGSETYETTTSEVIAFRHEYSFENDEGKDVFGERLPGYVFQGSDLQAGALGRGIYQNTPKKGIIQGWVYEDNNNNGLREEGENGIGNVLLKLQIWDGTEYVDVMTDGVLRTTRTNAYGFYSFENLDGYQYYRVCEVQPEKYVSGKNTAGSIDGNTVGQASDAKDWITDIGLPGNGRGTNYNFGELARGSLSGYVYEDNNNNGIKDDDEGGIEGVWLALYDQGSGGTTPIATVQTGPSGYYEFVNLDPLKTYRIVETQPDAYFDGRDAAGTINSQTVGTAKNPGDEIHTIALGPNQHGIQYNFGELAKGLFASSISGYVYQDRNNNGIREDGETGIEGVLLEIYAEDSPPNMPVARVRTDENGFYAFIGLDPFKTYRVLEVQPDGYIDGLDAPGTINGSPVGLAKNPGDEIHTIRLGLNEHGVEYNFGELPFGLYCGSLSGHVYVDVNDNGLREEGEAAIGNVKMDLYILNDDNEYVLYRSVVTDDAGYYEFKDLDPNRTYKILQEQPEKYLNGKITPGTVSGSASGIAVRDANEIHTIYVGLQGVGIDYDFGELIKTNPPKTPGSLSGTVYAYDPAVGPNDPNGTGIANVTLTLWKLVGDHYVAVATTQTAWNGTYTFTGLDAGETYRITETQPEGYNDGADRVGSLGGQLKVSDDMTDILVGSDQHGTGYDFGEERIVVPPGHKGSIDGHVYEDDDNDGVKDEGEKGIAGVKLALCVWDEAQQKFVTTTVTTVTDENGYYRFSDLAEGTYCITEIRDNIDDRYCDGIDTPGSNGGKAAGAESRLYEIPLGKDQNIVDYNFGELRRGSIGGYVYHDLDRNNIKNATEPGIGGVTITLWVLDEATGEYRLTGRTAVTAADGSYRFEGLCPYKTYRVTETQPGGYDNGYTAVGSLGGDATPMNGDDIRAIALPVGGYGQGYNFGELTKSTPRQEDPYKPPVPPFYIPNIGIGATGSYVSPSNFPWSPFVDSPLSGSVGGGGLVISPSWHLSLLNAGHPRSAQDGEDAQLLSAKAGEAARFINVAWTPDELDQGLWLVRDKYGRIAKRFIFGQEGAKPVAGDFNGDGIAEIAIFAGGYWYIDLNGNGIWDAEDLWCELGTSSDQPIVGDWDGDGKTDIGIFGPQWQGDEAAITVDPGLPSDLNTLQVARPKNVPPTTQEEIVGVRTMKHSARGHVRLDAIDHVFRYGGQGDVAITGDWNGDGVTKIGVYRDGDWYIDYNGDGKWNEGDIKIKGEKVEGAVPVVGDWSGEGVDRIGLFVDGQWMLDTTGDFKFDTTIAFGEKGDIPVVGDFSGNGVSDLAVYRPYSGEPLLTQQDVPSATAEAAPRVARQFGADSERTGTAQAAQNEQHGETLQGTLPEHLMNRQERTVHTPFTSEPLP